MDTLLLKYNIPVPRYTSYPTVPYWDHHSFTEKQWVRSLQSTWAQEGRKEGISLYLHLPFCESLCTFCGCHKHTTKNHSYEKPYLNALIKEWKLYLQRIPGRPKIAEIHLGGGTPTFFSPTNLQLLLKAILEDAEVPDDPKFSFEGHPANTSPEHLRVLADLGFRRVSFGIQDFDPKVQKAINRIQSFEQVQEVTDQARRLGYDSINYDIIYGLPFQRLSSIEGTMEMVERLGPDRIAFYSYAHVPWIKGLGQRKFSEKDLPKASLKAEMYQLGKELLIASDYREIAMDHFAKPEDELFKAFQRGHLHRNFMGYTESASPITLGLGVSAISDSGRAMAQNTKDLKEYFRSVDNDFLPVVKGHLRDQQDRQVDQVIHQLMCRLQTKIDHSFPHYKQVMDRLAEPNADHLIELENDQVIVTPRGKNYLRNIAMAFDLRLWEDQPENRIFSMAV